MGKKAIGMEAYYERDGITIYHGDCRDVMAGMEAGSVDTVMTDPPYGLSFMGKDWDHGVPGVGFWEAVLRVAKPGAMLLAFGGTRTHHRLMCAIEDAGREIRDVMMWVYGSGFPKNLDIAKAIDKAAGAEREVIGIKPGHSEFANRQTTGHIKSDDDIGGEHRFSMGIEAQQGYHNATAPATPAAAIWDGWGTALKPAWEPIVVAMKAVEGTFAQNALEHGVAGLWIGGTGVPADGEVIVTTGMPRQDFGGENSRPWHDDPPDAIPNPRSDRWPANLVHDGSDEVVGLFPDDNGNAARFFYCAKASRGERNAGLDGMPAIECQTGCGGDFPVDDNGRERDRFKTTQQNYHPTVKPLALMEYLCRLTRTPTGGVILDPFAGSGTTLVAAQRQGRRAIGIEIDEGYCEIAARRIPRQMVLL